MVIIPDRYSKISKATTTAKVTSTQVAQKFFHDRVIPYGIVDVILSEIDQQFVSRFLLSRSV